MQGAPKSFIIGILSGLLTTAITANPIAGIAVGASLGTGLELVDKSIRRKVEQDKIASKNALRLHYTALLRSD